MDASATARALRGLIYDYIMAGRATPAMRAQADDLARELGLPPPSGAEGLAGLEAIGRQTYQRMDGIDRAVDHATASADLADIPRLPIPPPPGDIWRGDDDGLDDGEGWRP